MSEGIDAKRLGEIMQAVLHELKRAGEPTRVSELLPKAARKLNLTPFETATLEKSGYVRWEAWIHWLSVDCAKAGLITKSGGRWTLTAKGEEALNWKPEDMVREARQKYADWRQTKAPRAVSPNLPQEAVPSGASEDQISRQTAYEQALASGRAEIERHISNLSPYDFQELVAELLKAMGYHVPFVAPPGADGGIDIIAYKDPLGTSSPRIRCQVKHRPKDKMNIAEVRALEGVLRKEGDMGLAVSSGGFTSDALREIQVSSKHIEAMDLDRLISLSEEHYEKAREAGKMLLPLVKVFYLAPPDEQA